jgi:hypothetical protein
MLLTEKDHGFVIWKDIVLVNVFVRKRGELEREEKGKKKEGIAR